MSEERQKWKRLGLPCETCRARKKRCDGTRPSCLACNKRGIGGSCEYISLPRHNEPRAKRSSTCKNQGIYRTQVVQNQHDAALTSNLTTTTRSASDGIATVALQDDGTAYGLSSTKAFLRHILSENELTASIDNDAAADQNSDVASRTNTATVHSSAPPSRKICDDCLACYWEYVWPIFPIVFRPTIEARYKQLFDQLFAPSRPNPTNDMEVDVIIATLLLILALGVRFCTIIPRDQRDLLRAELYQRSRSTFKYDILDTNSLSIIQMLLLSAVYLQSAPYAQRSWNTIGLAVRMAESLGLHQDARGGKYASPLDREMSRRVWYCCINIDRHTALAFGRPQMTKYDFNVPPPSMVDDAELCPAANSRSTIRDHSRARSFYVASNKLLTLLPEISDVYNTIEREATSQEECSTKDSILAKVLEVNRQLDHFAKELPDHLRITGSSMLMEYTNQVRLQRNVLIGRFLLMRLWLHRPLLARSIKAHANTNLQEEPSVDDHIIQKCCVTAVSTACKMIDLLHGDLDTLYRNLDTPNVYFGFVAGLVIVAFRQCNIQTTYGEIGDIDLALDRCIEVMAYYKEQNTSACQAHKVLQIIRRKLYKHNAVVIDSGNTMEASDGSNYSNSSDERININDVFLADQFPMDWFGSPMLQYDGFFC